MNSLKQILKLIINELYKTFFQKKTLAFVGILICSILIIAYYNCESDKGTDWRNNTQQQISNLKNNISSTKSKKDLSNSDNDMIKFQQEQLKILEYRLTNDLPDNVTTPLKFIYNCSNLIYLIVLYIAVFSANIVANEYSWGTIRQMLIKPVKRWKILLAKYLSMVVVSIILCTLLYILSYLIGFILFSKNNASMNDVIMLNGNIVERNMFQYVILSTLSQIFSIVIISSLTLLVATIVRAGSLATITTLVIYFGSFIGENYISKLSIYKFTLPPNLMLSKYLPGQELPYPNATPTFSFIICLIYLGIFLTGGFLIFNKRDIY